MQSVIYMAELLLICLVVFKWWFEGTVSVQNLSLSSHRSGTTFWRSMLIFRGGRIYLTSTGSSSSGEMEAQAGS